MNKELFRIQGKNYQASGYYENGVFTVLKGSILNPITLQSTPNAQARRALIKEKGTLNDNGILLMEDVSFKTPSAAASFCIGSSCNGWFVWKNGKKEKLGEVFGHKALVKPRKNKKDE
jgi:predicted type IV restriction endonuclease